MYAVTGASGNLGRLVIEQLTQRVPAAQIVAAVRNPDKARDLAALGVQVRQADYDQPQTLTAALKGVEKLLLISGSEVGKRIPQHRAVVDAAKRARVELLAYTSILRAETSGLALAKEHLATEHMIRNTGLAFSFLRNGWYFENYTERLDGALASGKILGSTQDGRIAAASRLDYAEAAVAALTASQPQGTYELAGDQPFTLSELAAEVSPASGKTITHQELPESALRDALLSFGLPAELQTSLSMLIAASRAASLTTARRRSAS
jgi:NAD(P)H dehydrogenase (quinone)